MNEGGSWEKCPTCNGRYQSAAERLAQAAEHVRRRRGTASQTLLSRMAVCPHSALLYMRHRSESHEMHRGSAFHEFARRATELLIEQDERSLPWEVAKDLVAEVVADHAEWVITPREMDHLRTMAYHWAVGVVIDPGLVVASERMFELELAGFTVRGKIDLASLDGQRAVLEDYKTSYLIPSQDDFDAGFQLPLYALLFAFGTPEGTDVCLGERVQEFSIMERYPMYLWDDGLAFRERTISRPELIDHRLYVEGVLGKLAHAYETDGWPAVSGSHCSTCAAPAKCPLPGDLRDHRGEINTPEEAAEAATALFFRKPRDKALEQELRIFAGIHGPIRYGADRVRDFREQESRKTDWEAMDAGIDRAVRYGEPFDASLFQKVQRSTRFVDRTLEAGELEAAEPEPVAAERWGDDAPW